MSKIALQLLEEKHSQLVQEKNRMIEKFDAEIAEVNQAMNTLCGKMLKEEDFSNRYDDENPSYITGTEDGI